jgi:RES domain-containing protein
MLYASVSRALACLETLVHLGAGSLPLNRYLIEIRIPQTIWRARERFDAGRGIGWDAEPPGLVSLDWGTNWAIGSRSLVAEVPSVIVSEEANVLLKPLHASMSTVQIVKCRRWTYDARFRGK